MKSATPCRREQQRRLLQVLEGKYPDMVFTKGMASYPEEQINADLAYLEEHGLIAVAVKAPMSGKMPVAVKLTAKGLDFLADDGGLSAVLGVITIKLHDDTLKRLISSKIEEADMPDTTKRAWLAALETLPAHGMQNLLTKLIDSGLENAPRLMPLLKPLFG